MEAGQAHHLARADISDRAAIEAQRLGIHSRYRLLAHCKADTHANPARHARFAVKSAMLSLACRAALTSIFFMKEGLPVKTRGGQLLESPSRLCCKGNEDIHINQDMTHQCIETENLY